MSMRLGPNKPRKLRSIWYTTLHKHVLHQEASVKEHHVSEFVIADTFHHILVLEAEAADVVCSRDNRGVHLLH